MTAVLERLLDRRDLSEAQAADLLEALADGRVKPAAAGAVLAALRAKGENAAELRGFALAMRRLARKPPVGDCAPLVDTCGTGGDGSSSLNLSTGAALLAAACGLRVAKHGNRSVSSRVGSADCFEAMGFEAPRDAERAAACLRETGFTFLFAPAFHPAMKTLAPIRRDLGVRTIFNLLGPLTNPAAPSFQLVGACDRDSARRLAETFAGLPVERVFVVHGENGWDEPTPVAPFTLFDVRPGSVREERRDPADYGLPRRHPQELEGGDAAFNARVLRLALTGAEGAVRDALVLGAALVLEVTGGASSLRAAAAAAAAAIDDGSAARVLDRLKAFSRKDHVAA